MAMKLQLHSAAGGGSVSVSEAAFGKEFNESLVHQVVTAYLARRRRGTKAQKTRAQVRGGGAKPWRQKGTGRARAGTIRSPIWVGGGRAFAASPRSYAQKVNRKMYQGAMRALLSELVRQERLTVVKELSVDAPKTKKVVELLKTFEFDNVLIVIEDFNEHLYLAARNLPNVDVLPVAALDPVSLVRRDNVLMTVGAVRVLEEKLG